MLPPRVTCCRPNRVCLSRMPGLAVAGISGVGEDNAGTVKRALNCDERAGMRIGPTQHAASAYSSLCHSYAIGKIVERQPSCMR